MQSAGRRFGQRPGVALLSLIVLISVTLILALAVVASMGIAADHERIEIASEVLAQLTDSSRVGITRFHADVTEYPGKLTHLRTNITTSGRDICRNTYSAGETDEWGFPYAIRHVSTSGMWTGIGQARDSLGKDPFAGTPSVASPHALVVIIDNVDERDAWLMNTRNDPEGEATPATLGRIRWGTPNSEGRVVLQWRKTITEC